MSPSPAYLLGRVTGFLVRPLLPLAESALAGVLDGLFGEPDALDATYTPTPGPPDPLIDHERHERMRREWLEAIRRPREGEEPPATVTAHWQDDPDEVWTLERDRIDQIAGNDPEKPWLHDPRWLARIAGAP